MTPRKRALALAVAGGQAQTAVAKSLNYADSTATSIGRVLKEPAVAALIESVQTELREKAMYNLQDAVDECDSIIAFAREQRNAMAMSKTLELKTKLLGYHRERIELVNDINIRTAMDDARARVATRIVNPPTLAAPIAEQPSHHAQDHKTDNVFAD